VGPRVRFGGVLVVVGLGVGVIPLALAAVGSGVARADPPPQQWAQLRQCESSGRYDAVADNGHYGAYQFDLATWNSVGGTGLPSAASPAEQDYRALRLYRSRGWQPWECAGILGLTNDRDAATGRAPSRTDALALAPPTAPPRPGTPRPDTPPTATPATATPATAAPATAAPATAASGSPSASSPVSPSPSPSPGAGLSRSDASPPPWPGVAFAPGGCDPRLRAWQLQMNTYGYNFTGTGCYGDITRGAVLDLQRANHLPETSPLTQATWLAAWTGTSPTGAPRWPGRVYVVGDCDSALSAWQLQMARHGYPFHGTGCYGDTTRDAVLDLQRAHHLPASGRLGPLTWLAAWTGPLSTPPSASPAPPGTAPTPPSPSTTTAAPPPPSTPTPTGTTPSANTPPATTATTAPAPSVVPPVPPAGPPVVPPVGTVASSPEAAVRYGWGVPLPSSDTFTYTGAPDPAKWDQAGECWPGNAGNGQRCASHTTVGGGFLRESGDAAGRTGWLANTTNQKYGRWEARARMTATDPTATGNPYHPVLLLWPQSERWPQDGEDDYAETHIGADGIDAFIHHPTPSGVVQDHYSTPVELTSWHNYAIEWQPGHIRGYLDGVQWFDDTDPAAQPPGPMHGTIQLDDSTGGTQQPAHLDVQWFRVYAP